MAKPSRPKPAGSRPRRRRAASAAIDRTPMADGFLPLQREPETNWLVSFLYPLRGAESLAVPVSMAAVAWVFAVLVPEYCLQAIADASMMGAGPIGLLFTVVAFVPVAILAPMFLSYWHQYLGRVLVSSAMGECAPPRTPDRNVDGLFNGLSPWFIWLVLGVVVGMAPASLVSGDGAPWPSVLLAVAALPYVLAALMLCFLHDSPMAAMPWAVASGLLRLGPSFLILCTLIAAALGMAGGAVVLMLWFRARHFWPYLFVAPAWWLAFLWIEMVIMRLLGVFYFRRKDALKWNRAHPRWGVAWRL